MINLTENALAEIRRRAAAENRDHATVCVGLEDGGCAGTSYVLEFGVAPRSGQVSATQAEFTLLVAEEHMPLLQGLEVDFVDSLVGGGFRFRNPNAARTCGCGSSFAPLQELAP